jgi:hypothetical protein
MSSRHLIAVAFIAVLLGGAGCSSKSDGPTGSSNQTTMPQCPAAATMKSELGIAYSEPIGNATAKERNCLYTSTDGTLGNATVHFQIMAGASDFAGVKVGYGAGGRTTADVSGLGDAAFSSVLTAGGFDTNTMATHKGLLQILVTSRASLDKEKAFIAKLLG